MPFNARRLRAAAYLPLVLPLVLPLLLALPSARAESFTMNLFDPARARPIAVEIYLPDGFAACTAARPCPAALLSHGYGMDSRAYGFLADALTARGYLVASIGHEAPDDPKMDPAGDLPRQRAEMARRGAANIRFAHGALARAWPGYDWGRTLLVGHSLGGDSAAWLAANDPAGIAALVTLDNRRAALPRSPHIRVLSLRASDTGADPGVLPSPEEQRRFKACIVTLADARHDDMSDAGPPALRRRILAAVAAFLGPDAGACPSNGVE